MLEIRKIRIRSVIKVSIAIHVVLYVLAGLIVAALYAVVHGLLLRSFFSSGISALNLLLIWLAGTVVVAAHALILGWIVGLIYNLIASWWGGIVVEVGVVNGKQTATVVETSISGVSNTDAKPNIPQSDKKAGDPQIKKKEQRRKTREKQKSEEKKESSTVATAVTDSGPAILATAIEHHEQVKEIMPDSKNSEEANEQNRK